MRRIFVLLWPLLMLPVTASSQISCERQIDGPGKKVSGSPAPIFELQKPFEHPVALPSHVLALLRADEQSADKFETCRSRKNLAQIPAKWFVATEIKMANDGLPGRPWISFRHGQSNSVRDRPFEWSGKWNQVL